MKVNVIKIKNETAESVAFFSVSSRELDGTARIFDWIRRFECEQASNVFGLPIKSLNISEYHIGDGYVSTYQSFKGQVSDVVKRSSFTIDGRTNAETQITQKNPVVLADGTEADFCAGIDFIRKDMCLLPALPVSAFLAAGMTSMWRRWERPVSSTETSVPQNFFLRLKR